MDILLVDDSDDDIVLMEEAFAQSTHLRLAGMVRDGEQALAYLRRSGEFKDAAPPDLVMLDARFGLEPPRLLRSTLPHVRVILIATSDQETDLGEAVRAGVVAYLLKEERISDLVQALRLVLRGQLVAPAALARRTFRPTRQGLTALDDQERRILARIAQGATNRDIARELSLSERTVRRRVVQIYATLQVSDRFDAALFAARHNLVEPDQTPGGDAHG